MKTLDARALRGVEQKMDDVVILAEEAIKQTKVYGRRCEENHWALPSEERCPKCQKRTRPILQRAQLSNLQSLANATDSVKALELFIRYQMGRKEGRGWQYSGDSDKPFGYLVIDDFDTLARWAEEIAPSQKREVHLWLIRLYVGYLSRWFVALGGETAGEGGEEG